MVFSKSWAFECIFPVLSQRGFLRRLVVFMLEDFASIADGKGGKINKKPASSKQLQNDMKSALFLSWYTIGILYSPVN